MQPKPSRAGGSVAKVGEIMVKPVVMVEEETSLEDAARLMLERRIGCLVVVDGEGKLAGIITESDFTGRERGFPFSAYRAPQVFGEWVDRSGVERIYREARRRRVGEIMTRRVVTGDRGGAADRRRGRERLACRASGWLVAPRFQCIGRFGRAVVDGLSDGGN